MNIEQAKQIPLESFLSRLGFEPSRRVREQLWYSSPFRNESTPSFKICTTLNAWYDFGKGDGGDIIDFVKQLDQLSSVSEALARINELFAATPIPVRTQTVTKTREATPSLDLTSIGRVQAKSLFAYLRNRGINPKRVEDIVQEAHYRRDNDAYFALAFANNSGGYELRSPYFKGTLGTKDITTIKGNSSHVLVFEGFFDFLTAVMIEGKPIDATVIVLNSVAMRERAVNAIRKLNPQTVELYRDRDQAGEQLLEFLRNALPEALLIDKSELYAGHNDLNEWYATTCRSNSTRMQAECRCLRGADLSCSSHALTIGKTASVSGRCLGAFRVYVPGSELSSAI